MGIESKGQQPEFEAERVTCDSCGKMNGDDRIGTHWICEDCKVDPNHKQTDEE